MPEQVSISVRLEGPSEAAVRAAAVQMGVQVSQVKPRGDCWHLYGSRIVSVIGQKVTVTTLPRNRLE
ncbi:unnamed protein product [Sphagnum jensenii]|uniref:Uncharacterized protein n=1 Tax=Sphagnum jensenii TaxID=128206 RepID=A0ABP0VE60_9BRYO